MVFLGHLPHSIQSSLTHRASYHVKSIPGDTESSSFMCWFTHSPKQLSIANISNIIIIIGNVFINTHWLYIIALIYVKYSNYNIGYIINYNIINMENIDFGVKARLKSQAKDLSAGDFELVT